MCVQITLSLRLRLLCNLFIKQLFSYLRCFYHHGSLGLSYLAFYITLSEGAFKYTKQLKTISIKHSNYKLLMGCAK